jgi:hypothetical protein
MKKSNAQIEFENTHCVEELGPNWQTVLNFWLFLDNLSEEQSEVAVSRNSEMHFGKRQVVDKLTIRSVDKVIP